MTEFHKHSSSQLCHTFGGALPTVSKSVAELCKEITVAKEICQDRDSAGELRDLALSVATIERVLETPFNARTDAGGFRSLLDLIEDTLHSIAETLHQMCDLKRRRRRRWIRWLLMPAMVACGLIFLKWSKRIIWKPEPRTLFDSSFSHLWQDFKNQITRYLLRKRRTGFTVALVVLWSRFIPSLSYQKRIAHLKLLHQRLFLLLRLWQLVRSISEYTDEMHVIDPSIFFSTEDVSWDERLIKVNSTDHIDERKPPARLLLEKVPMTHTAGFWYSSTLRFRLIITTFQILYSTISFGQKMPSRLLKYPALLLSGIYYTLRPGEAAFKMSELMSKPTYELVEEVWGLIDSPMAKIYSHIASPKFAVEKLCEIKRGDSPLPIRFRVISLTPLPEEFLAHLDRCQSMTFEEIMNNDVKLIPPMREPLIYHIHGGGFIGNFYLTDRPVLGRILKNTPAIMISVDYALAPKHPYPAGLNDCWDTYRLIISEKLGIIPTSIVLTGDSAGGNLSICVTTKAIEANVRIPDGVAVAYPVTSLTITPSPSRVVFMPDLLVPLNMLTLCQRCYVPPSNDPSKDYLLSPLVTPPEVLARFPPTSIIVGQWDPFCDDACDFAARLAGNKVSHRLKVYDRLPHGFLNMLNLLPEVEGCIDYMSEMISDLLHHRKWSKTGVIP